MADSDLEFYKKAYEQEIQKRQKAEKLAEEKAAQLFTAKRTLTSLSEKLERQAQERTDEMMLLARIPNELPDPFMRISRDGSVAFMNVACQTFWQPELKIQLGESYPAIFAQPISIALMLRETQTKEFKIGEMYWSVQFTAVECYSYLNIISHNITAQQQAELALRKSQTDLQEAHNLAGLGHWELDLENTKLSWSDLLYDQYGIDDYNDIPTFEKIYKYVDPADLDRVKREISGAIETGYTRFEFKISRPDGQIRHLQTTIKLDTNEIGQATRLHGTSLDITNLRSTQAQLLESEQRFDLAVQGMNDGIWDLNLKDGTVYTSPQYKQQLGYNETDLSNQYDTLIQLIHPQDISATQQLINAYSPNTQTAIKTQIRMLHKNGHYLHLMVRAVVLRNNEGEIVRVVGSNTDISERIAFERQQQKSLEQLQILSEISLIFNQSLESLDELLDNSIALVGRHMGVDHAYILDNSLQGIFASITFDWHKAYDLNQEAPTRTYYNSIAFEKALLKGNLVVNNIDSLPNPLLSVMAKQNIESVMAVPFKSSGGITGFVGVDVSSKGRTWSEQDIELLKTFCNLLSSVFERAQAHLYIAKSEEKYRSLVENLTEVIFQVDLNYKLEFVNPAWEQITSYTEEETIGNLLTEYMLPADRDEFDRFRGLMYDNQIDFSQQIARLRTKQGEIRYVEIFAKLRVNDFDVVIGLSGTLADVTEREMNREKLIRAKEEAEAASSAKAQFLSVISHEIRTPLNALLGISNLLLRQNPRFDQEQNLKLLKLSGENLLLLINDILDFNKIEAGRVTLNRQPLSIKTLCQDLVNALDHQARQKGLSLNFIFDEAIPELVLGDGTRLSQILTNLLDNAIKFTHHGKILLHVKQEGVIGEVNRLRFIVADTGIGISDTDKEIIFKAFTQAGVQISDTYGGTGLGLSIVERLLELHGSAIELESTINQGSTFSFVIPYQNYTPEIAQSTEPKEPKAIANTENNELLLVEDNPLNILVINQFLEGWGIKPEVAESGTIALDILKKKKFNLVLMDLHMPGIDGFETTRRIREDLNLITLPIIALTANAMPGIRQKVLAAGMTDYISKPFEPEVLYQKLQRYYTVHEYKYPKPANADKNLDSPTNLAFYSLDKLLAESNGNPEFVNKMVNHFLTNAHVLLPTLLNGIINHNAQDIKHVAHKLKPSIIWLDIASAKPLIKSIELLPAEYVKEEYQGIATELHRIIQLTADRLNSWLSTNKTQH